MTRKKPGKQDNLFQISNQYQPFGVVPEEQGHPPFMLLFKMKNGNIHGSNYNFFLDAIYSPTRIIFRFHDTSTIIKGRNLKPIIEALTRYRLDYIQEWEPGMGTVPESAPCIDSITEELPKELALLEAGMLTEADKHAGKSSNG